MRPYHRQGQIGVLEATIKAMAEFRQPKTRTDVRAFLGTAGYYRKFLKDYAAISAPLPQATQKTEPMPVDWNTDRLEAFHVLHKSLSDCVCILECST